MSTLFDCSENSCFEALLETLITGVTSVMYMRGFRVITKDRNNILNRINKIIYGLGMAQMIILFLYFSFWGSDMMISTIRSLRLVTEALLCSTLAEIVYEEVYYERIQVILKLVLTFVFLEWFWTALINQSIYEYIIFLNYLSYFCLQIDYLMLSGTTLILSLFAAYIGMTAMDLLKSFQEETIIPEKGQGQSYDEMSNKQFQIKFLLGSGCFSAFVQFIWDYIAYTNAHTLNDCKRYYEAYSFGGVLIFIKKEIIFYTIMKFITLVLSPMTIYIVFYYAQRQTFNTSTAQLLDTDVFFDDRSLMQRYSSKQSLSVR